MQANFLQTFSSIAKHLLASRLIGKTISLICLWFAYKTGKTEL